MWKGFILLVYNYILIVFKEEKLGISSFLLISKLQRYNLF